MALDMSKYLGLFVQEATEHLDAFGRDLMRLEREGHRQDIVDSLFRHAHSVKGMAASMGFGAIAALAHRAEDLVDRFRGHPEALTPDIVDALLAIGDRLLDGVRHAGAGRSEPEAVDPEARLSRTVESGPPAPPESQRATVRVRTDRLDGFLEAVGELFLASSRLRELARSLPDRERPVLEEGVDALSRIVRDLQTQVMAVRMTPMAFVTDRLPRAARDLARQLGREVEVEITGADIELDRAILEELHDPLLHLVRNCVDHGLEPPEERIAAGKPARGRLAVRSRRDRDRVVVEIEDDGRGMDPEGIQAAAVARGTVTADAARALSLSQTLQLAFLPGVSTARTVSDLSGRGVGLDAARRAVEAVGGTVEVDTAPGRGTRFAFRLPPTIAVVRLLLVRVGEELLGLPIAKVIGAVEADPATLDRTAAGSWLRHDGGLVPVHRLASLLERPEGCQTQHPCARSALARRTGPASRAGSKGLEPAASSSGVRPHVVVEADGGRLAALEVDRLVGQEEVVLKPAPPPLDRLPGLLGVTILGTGQPLFILDVPRLLAA